MPIFFEATAHCEYPGGCEVTKDVTVELPIDGTLVMVRTPLPANWGKGPKQEALCENHKPPPPPPPAWDPPLR